MLARFVVALAFSLVSSSCARAPVAPPTPQANGAGVAAWERLKSTLPGSWTMPGKHGDFVVTYTLISGGSALVEHWGAGTPVETETIFHPDHAELLLTHYCAQGNQPRLRAAEVSRDGIVFRFVDVTNRSPDQGMLIERRLRFGQGTFDDTETYSTPEGKDDVTTYHFTRVGRLGAFCHASPQSQRCACRRQRRCARGSQTHSFLVGYPRRVNRPRWWVALASLLLATTSCADKKPTAIVLAISSEMPFPAELATYHVKVERSGSLDLDEDYDGAKSPLPGTLTLKNGSSEDASAPALITLTAKSADGSRSIERQARLGFVEESSKLLRLRLERSCLSTSAETPKCVDGVTTCIDGTCQPIDVDPSTLPDFTSNADAVAGEGAAGAAGQSGGSGAAGMVGGHGGQGVGGIGGGSGHAGQGGAGGSAGQGTGGIGGAGGVGGHAAQGGAGAGGKSGAGGSVAGTGGGGASGESGQGGLGGVSGGGQGGGFDCSMNHVPVAKVTNAASTVHGGSTVTLDGSMSSDADGQTFTYSWTATNGGPVILSGAASAVAMLVADACGGPFDYALTVTDGCNATSVPAVATIMVMNDGPHVSASTCIPGSECGSTTAPWCQVTSAVQTAYPGVSYQVATGSYDGALTLQTAGAITIEGGYDPTFVGAPDPVKNVVVLNVAAVPLTAAAGDVTLRGLTVTPGEIASPPPDRTAILLTGAGTNLTLDHVVCDGTQIPTASAMTGYTVSVDASATGTLTLTSASLGAMSTGGSSAALFAPAQSSASLASTSSTFHEGPNSTSWGIRWDATGSVTMNGDIVTQADETATIVGIEIANALQPVALTNVTVSGGDPPSGTSTAVSLQNITGNVTLDSCNLSTAMTLNASGIAYGLLVQSVTSLTVTGGTIRGTSSQGPGISQSTGVQLSGGGMVHLFDGVTVEGGQNGTKRIGMHALSSALRVQGASLIDGSTIPGGSTLYGIQIEGDASPGAYSFLGTTHIRGGQTTGTAFYVVKGIESSATSPVTISGNAEITGCTGPCDGVGGLADGVYYDSGSSSSLLIEGPGTIVGGPSSTTSTTHTGISVVVGSTVTTVTIQNGLVAIGNPDSTHKPTNATGISAVWNNGNSASPFTINDVTAHGGFGLVNSNGIQLLGASGTPPTVTIQYSSAFSGNTMHPHGMDLTNVLATVNANLIDSCSPMFGCPTNAVSPIGIHLSDCTNGTNIANNYVFAGQASSSTSTACKVDITAVPDIEFENNLFVAGLAGTDAAALVLSDTATSGFVSFYNNLFFAAATTNETYISDAAGTAGLGLRANVFLPKYGTPTNRVLYLGKAGSTTTIAQVETATSGMGDTEATDFFYVNSDNPADHTIAGWTLPSAMCPTELDITVQPATDYSGKARPFQSTVGPQACH